MFNEEITLVKKNNTYDKAGNKETHETKTTLLCEVRSSTRQEFYDYGDDENRPEFVVTINLCEYGGEKTVLFRNHEYRINRTYEVDRDLIELTLTRRISR